MSRYIVFDLDGTIVDSNRVKSRVLVESLPFFSVGNEERLRNYDLLNLGLTRGERIRKLFWHYLNRFPSEEEYEATLLGFESAYEKLIPSIAPLNGFEELMSSLHLKRQVVLPVIISAGVQRDLDLFSSCLGLGRVFDTIVSSAGSTKFDVANIFVPKSAEVLYTVGDTFADSELAILLGSRFYAIYGADFSCNSGLIGSESLFELAEIIKGID